MPPYQPKDLKGFLQLFAFDKKRELEHHSRTVVVHKIHFVAFIDTCKQGDLPFEHRAHFDERVPTHLRLQDTDRGVLTGNRVGPLNPKAAKLVTMVQQIFSERRCLAGHMFYSPSHYAWHFFAFDQRDTDEREGNHWANGAHVHFVNWLWPHLELQSVWSKFVEDGEKPGSSLHIRWDDGRQRRRANLYLPDDDRTDFD
jgi:hypothetical protein